MIIKPITRNARHPKGFWGSMMIKKMNLGHSQLTAWALEEIGFAPTDHVLDVGCGGGKAIARILPLVPQGRVDGIDFSCLSVEKARKENRKAIRERRSEIFQTSVSKLPFPDSSFAVVTAIETIYFWPDPPGDFHEIWRVLKPHGRLAVVCEMVQREGIQYTDVEELLKMRVPTIANVEAFFTSANFTHMQAIVHPRTGWLCMIGEKPAPGRQ